MVVDLGSDAPTPGRGLYHGGDTGSHVANPGALCIKSIFDIKYRKSTNYRQTLLLYGHFTLVSEYAIVIHA